MVSISEFWRLAVESRLFTTRQIEGFRAEFGQVKGASQQGNVKTLLEWMISRKAISRYQAKILAGGRSGPFYYGDYKVYDRSEQGRWAGMFHAVHVGTGHPVLLQFLTGPVTQDARQWTATASRVQAYTVLRHPFVARIHELVDLVSFKFLTLEDPPGQCLTDPLAQSRRWDPTEACRLIREAALGLGELHGRQLIHGDIRPKFLWLTEDGHLKILVDPVTPPAAPQFGNPGADGELLSRADYLAPEFTRPNHAPDRLSDIYALGCVFFEMLTGKPPFAGGDLTDKLQRHAEQPIQPLEPLGVPQPIAQVVAFMMAKNPSVRYQHAGIVAEQLQAFVDPERLNLKPAIPATLAAYEGAVRQKHQNLASQPASTAPSANANAAAPAINTRPNVGSPSASPAAASPSPPAPVSSAPVSSAPVSSAPVPAGAHTGRIAAPSLEVVPSTSSSADGAKAPRRLTDRGAKQIKPLMVGGSLAAVAAVIIVAIVIMNSIGRGPSPAENPGGDVAQAGSGNPGQNQPTTQVRADVPRTDRPGTGQTGTGQTGTGQTGTGQTGTGQTGTGQTGNGQTDTGQAEPAPRQTVVPDDGELLWASPTSGSPIALNYIPPGGQAFMHVRPADLATSEQGHLVLEALGPAFAGSRTAWESAAGVKLDQVERLLVVLYDNGEQFPRPFFAVWLPQLVQPQTLLSGWGNPAAVKAASGVYYKSAGQSYLIPGEAGGPTFLMGAEPEIELAVELQGAVAPLRRGMGQLLASTDSQRHFTMLLVPSYLSSAVFRDGRNFFFGDPAALRGAIEWLLGDDLQAASVSMQFEDKFFWEARLFSSLNRDTESLASDMRDRLAEIPTGIERHIVGLNPHPYWRMVAFRYPAMIRYLHRQARIGVEGPQAVINGVMPGAAAHNLVFGGEMVLGAGAASPVAVVDAPPTGPKTNDDVLKLNMDMMFDQTSLEFSMRDLAADINETHKPSFDFGIKIIGDDLKLDGITRNQQIRNFSQQGKTVGEILTALVMKANPVTTVKKPSETDQKLIWVVGPDPDNPSRKIVLITTRAAAETKKYTLPATFVP